MFTDIVGSTARAADLGDSGWRRQLERHDEITRGHTERFGGRVVKGTGDGFLATFDGPARAIRCATAVGAALRQSGIEIRAGIHTGECELIGDDIGGMAVHIGARIAALAGPSEVLVSRTVKDLVVGSGIVFDDRGSHSLKGVPDEWTLYAARL
jgi:class 3 adenylate cyclase